MIGGRLLDYHGLILRVTDTWLGPDDTFCIVWSFLDLIGVGTADWRPKFNYQS